MSETTGGLMRFNGMNCKSISNRRDPLQMDFKERVIVARKI